MALGTFSKFYYLEDSVSNENQNLNFDEGGGELSAAVEISAYTVTSLMTAVTTALNAAGGQEYTVSFDRDTRQVTISATSNFDLLISTGSQVGSSLFAVLGFTGGIDLTATNTYTGESPLGSVYFPQFPLQDYVDPANSQDKIQPAINEAASGVIEIISFGTRKFMECNILFITNLPQDCAVIKNNPTGLADAQAFMQFITNRTKLEFMPDEKTASDFETITLERTATNSKGVGYTLKEETGKDLPGYYTTGKLKFRVD